MAGPRPPGRARRRKVQGPVPESARPPGIAPPAAGEWAFVGVCLVVLAAGVGPGWLPWVLRIVGALMVIGWIVARIRYRVRRGERVWLWHRI